jgi:23S rRNA (cytidine1920-2'-O)/16S rRNA (cytidine1409-2'-O)-methyltransferase
MIRFRLDELLVQQQLAQTRSQAQAFILEGRVLVDGKVQTKAGAFFSDKAKIQLVKPSPYVGRGGYKLEKALDVFGIKPDGKVCLDIGASTGGFTDCLLQRGAKKVYAVDVGKGQLAWRLRLDPRVVCLEKVNARYLSEKEVPEKAQLCTIDVSFISAKKILPAVRQCVGERGEFLVLVKPQFEAGREKVKKGIVKEKETHLEVLSDMVDWACRNAFHPAGATFSPITGGDGNIEFFLYFNDKDSNLPLDLVQTVEEAHLFFRCEKSLS